MSIKIEDNTDDIIIINNKQEFVVSDAANKVEIVNIENCFEVTENVAETIIINATDVILNSSSSTGALDIEFNCSADENIKDAVYLFSSGSVRKADNSSINTAKVIGFISEKLTATTCKVRIAGELSGFTLVANKYYFLGSAGLITDTPPTTLNSVLVRIGQAITSSKLLININNNYIIRNG